MKKLGNDFNSRAKKKKTCSFHHLIPFLTGLFVLFVFLLGDEAVMLKKD
jgi:hypothetical protein